jgi:hypothetical protein
MFWVLHQNQNHDDHENVSEEMPQDSLVFWKTHKHLHNDHKAFENQDGHDGDENGTMWKTRLFMKTQDT